MTIIVSLKTQKAYAYRNGVAIGVSTVSTGAKGHATPTGVFTVLQKDADHVSNIYEGAAMPFMQRLTWGGIAMHGGNLPGYPASHGCIRLPLAFAKLLFGITRMGVTVVITQDALVPVVVATPAILARGHAARGPDGASVWNPALSPSGPVSIVISGRDKRVVVLRNGIEIGSSPIALDQPVEQTAAFTLQSIDASGEHWLRLPLPGDTRRGELSAADRAQGRLPEDFKARLATVLLPGTTLLVTRETLVSAGTGRPVTIIEDRRTMNVQRPFDRTDGHAVTSTTIWHAMTSKSVMAAVGTSADGLRPDDAAERLVRDGRNELAPPPTPSLVLLVLRQFNSPLIHLLSAAAAVSFGLGHRTDAGFIGVVLVVNAMIGTFQEGKAAEHERFAGLLRMPDGDRLVLLLEDVPMLDASGVAAIVELVRRADGAKTAVILCGAAPQPLAMVGRTTIGAAVSYAPDYAVARAAAGALLTPSPPAIARPASSQRS